MVVFELKVFCLDFLQMKSKVGLMLLHFTFRMSTYGQRHRKLILHSVWQILLYVKAAVLKAYELVQKMHLQKFRSWNKSEKQSHMEFLRDLSVNFKQCSSLSVHTYKELEISFFKSPKYIQTCHM